ncbi:uncharacterized protein EKO05_0005212 [Ascochyta rabiei]|uniref:uncharacterized protein n=1 Tax=Didymella rabiei TaxID=5454 RepID=UPI00220573A7|nr:uncharacterized protein EKO05_0005212 [Ascochyta rabiei]UPX14738.1 hypothetical protein EKO05_0005212 [Ascochyta rabiei]
MRNARPCFHLQMPAARDIVSPASSLILKLLSVPIFFVLPTTMPPLSGFKKLHHAGQLVSNFEYDRLIEVSVVILVAATIIWFAVAWISRRGSRTVEAGPDAPEKSLDRPLVVRQDSAICCQKHWESYHNDRLNSLQQEILQHTKKPIHPWILPPQKLPGPYDPMYYPLPPPTIRPVSPRPPREKSEGRHSTSYTRLVPATGAPPEKLNLYGTMTMSTKGWRRTHWNVTGG